MAIDQPIKIMSAIALRPILTRFANTQEVRSAQEIQLHFDTNPRIAKRVQSGDEFDVVLLNRRLFTPLIEDGCVDPATLVAIGYSPLGIGGSPTAQAIDVSTVEKFAGFLKNAKSIGYTPQGSSGERLLEIIATLQLTHVVGTKLVAVAGGDAGRAVAEGDVDFCIVPITTILASKAKLLAVLPNSLDATITFHGAIGTRARKGNDGRSLLEALTNPVWDEFLAGRGVKRLRLD